MMTDQERSEYLKKMGLPPVDQYPPRSAEMEALLAMTNDKIAPEFVATLNRHTALKNDPETCLTKPRRKVE
ncbi:hypothetical protein [Chitinimonas sp.]|uniref:hypothetical protein n=1 Tax=Chitinimonas sp. TaxID=1934313 RepID=UPI0035B1AE79